MPLCDYFVASSAELQTVRAEGVSAKLLKVEAKGFDMVPIAALAHRLDVAHAVDPGKPFIHGEDFEWFVQRLTTPMLDALSGLDADAVAKHGSAVAKIPELEWRPKDVQALLRSLVTLANAAKKANKSMHMWVSA